VPKFGRFASTTSQRLRWLSIHNKEQRKDAIQEQQQPSLEVCEGCICGQCPLFEFATVFEQLQASYQAAT
jgi:hypothetical protein